jgi:4a-hydroxytetrahydrobiopterin dehydratase
MSKKIGFWVRLGVAIALPIVFFCNRPTLVAANELQRLSEAEIAERLPHLPGWTSDGQQLVCTYPFENFVEAIAFVNRLVEPAEAAGHHPDLTVSYNRVGIHLTTHDAGGLTQLDFEVAQAIAHLSPSPCL